MKKLVFTVLAVFMVGNPGAIQAYYSKNTPFVYHESSVIKDMGKACIVAGASIITMAIIQSLLTPQGNASSNLFDVHAPGTIKESFQSVAGAHQAKEELQYIVDFLQNPMSYTNVGAKMPSGILLAGAPGTGKTLLARALAGEANCAFINVNGSDFSLKYAGDSVAKIKALFKKARKYPTTIIFIDEIDAVGSQRSQNTDSVSKDINNTINQLLVEMDGFNKDSQKSTVVVIAATNYPHILDKALLRPGRFDRIIFVDLPTLEERAEILLLNLRKINTATCDKITALKFAAKIPNFSGAQIAQLVNQAALIAARKKLPQVTMLELQEAIKVITA